MSNSNIQTQQFATQLVHHAHSVDQHTGAVSVPVHHTSTFHQFDWNNYGTWDYARSSNPTRDALEQHIAQLENGVQGFAFASGMAAIAATLLTLKQGEHVIVPADVYGGTFRLVTKLLGDYGIQYTFVDMTDIAEVEAAIQANTKMIYVETPSNPLLAVADLRAICELAKKHEAIVAVDNTFMTPYLQQPLNLGADIVIHSATKFIGGHSDSISGLVVVSSDYLAKRIGFMQNTMGGVLSPDECFLVMRGLKTLALRMDRGQQTAEHLVAWFLAHPKVKDVYYPTVAHHKGREIHAGQANGGGACFSILLENEQAVRTFVENVKLGVFAVSLGAVETILSYPARMSHASMSKQERHERGIADGLLRISVGVEDANDLQMDFEAALSYVK
ncbi:MAG: aminotransferase class I/II-fold pyridoxal phosphate-dependent enzyme [Bacilli bacterium]